MMQFDLNYLSCFSFDFRLSTVDLWFSGGIRPHTQRLRPND